MKRLCHELSKAVSYCKIVFISVIGVLVFYCEGCDLFRTRNPEEPEQSSAQYVPPTEPSIVFENMKNAFSDKNEVNYLRSFVDDGFQFTPSSQASSEYSSIFLNWSKDNEGQYFTKLCSKYSTVLVWTQLLETSRTSSSTTVEAQYSITGLPNGDTAKGASKFELETLSSQLWAIKKWDDYDDTKSGKRSWSYVKATNSQ